MTDARPIKLGDEDLPDEASTPSSSAQGPKASPKPKAKPKAVPKSVSTTMAWGDLDVLDVSGLAPVDFGSGAECRKDFKMFID